MILRLLLAFSVFLPGLAEVSLDQLKWQPDLITKESILTNHKDLKDNEPLFTDIPQLVFVADWNHRGFLYARTHAKRINYLSNTWFEVAPRYDMMGNLVNVDINGKENFDRQFVIEMRKLNPNIKMVPRFLFQDWPQNTMIQFVDKETLVLKCVQTIANFIRKYGFDGAVIDIFAAFTGAMDSAHFTEGIETLVQIGSILQRNEQVAILSMPAPANAVPVNNEGKDNLLLPQEHGLKLLDGYDFIQVWTYSDALHLRDRTNVHDEFLERNIKYFDYSPKLLIGINFFGTECNLNEYQHGYYSWRAADYRRFLEVLKSPDAVYEFNEATKEHELTSISLNAFILYPSLTSLEYRLSVIKQYPGTGVAFWDYGQGLDYFTNMV